MALRAQFSGAAVLACSEQALSQALAEPAVLVGLALPFVRAQFAERVQVAAETLWPVPLPRCLI